MPNQHARTQSLCVQQLVVISTVFPSAFGGQWPALPITRRVFTATSGSWSVVCVCVWKRRAEGVLVVACVKYREHPRTSWGWFMKVVEKHIYIFQSSPESQRWKLSCCGGSECVRACAFAHILHCFWTSLAAKCIFSLHVGVMCLNETSKLGSLSPTTVHTGNKKCAKNIKKLRVSNLLKLVC